MAMIHLEKEHSSKSKFYNLKYKNQLVYPILYSKLVLSRKSVGSKSFSISQKIATIWSGFVYLIKLKTNGVDKSDVLFVSSNHYEAEENDRHYDKFISPFIEFLEKHDKSYKIARFSNQLNTPKSYFRPKQLVPLQSLGLFYTKFKRSTKATIQAEDMKATEEIAHSLGTKNLSSLELINYFEYFDSLKNLYKKYLIQSETKFLVVVCYYDLKSFAFIKAANELNIKSIDLQHGLQGKEHFAYSYWPSNLVEQSQLFPTHFWCWDKYSLNVIREWFPQPENVILGYNKWMVERYNPIEKDCITFSLQPEENPIPDILIEALLKYVGPLKWCFRLHPHQLANKKAIEDILKAHNIFDKVELEHSTLMPLSELLNRTKIHITIFSSVVLESYWYHIPSIVLSEKGWNSFKESIPQNLLYKASSSEELLEHIYDLTYTGIEQNDITTHQDFGLLANKFFKYE